MEKLTQDELDRLRLSVKEAATTDIGMEWKEGADPEWIETIDQYLLNFAARKRNEDNTMSEGNPCLRCDKQLQGSLARQLFYSDEGFAWGMAHGHGYCKNCGWPCQLYHRVVDKNGEELMKFRHVVLQVHPKHIEIT